MEAPSSHRVVLRTVQPGDLPVFFENQRDPDAVRMAAFPARERDAFEAHWAKILADPTLTTRTILLDGAVAGNIGAWGPPEERLVGYWIGKDYWGRGVASRALVAFLDVERLRPLYAHVAGHNQRSIRVLEKGGFVRCDRPALCAADDGVDELLLVLAAPSSG